jgi:hypothetical protein
MLGPSSSGAEVVAGRQLGRAAACRLALREAPPPVRAAAQQSGRGVLGQRETDVARLVAEGPDIDGSPHARRRDG